MDFLKSICEYVLAFEMNETHEFGLPWGRDYYTEKPSIPPWVIDYKIEKSSIHS